MSQSYKNYIAGEFRGTDEAIEVRNPADRRDRVGRVVCASPADIDQALRAAAAVASARPNAINGCCACAARSRRPSRSGRRTGRSSWPC